MKKEKVAVYGSLLKGLGNHGRLNRSDCKLLGTDIIYGPYTMVPLGGFPGVILDPNKIEESNSPIVIEVYEVPEEVLLHSLDRLEGFSPNRSKNDNFYNREKIKTKYGDTWIYFYNYDGPISSGSRHIIEDGDWRSYVENKMYK